VDRRRRQPLEHVNDVHVCCDGRAVSL